MLTFINFRPAFAILAAYSVRRREMKGGGRATARKPSETVGEGGPRKSCCKSAKDVGMVFCNGALFCSELFIPVEK